MQKNRAKRVLALAISLAMMSFVAGCAHMEKSPPERHTGYAYIHKPLPEASRKVDTARAAGKEKECPNEFKAAKDTVDNAYAIYIACRTQEGIAMAQDGINKLNALCPYVAPPPPPAPTASLSADPASIKQNRCATLSWSSANASSASIDQGIGSVAPSGSKQVCPVSTTRYTMTVAGAGGSQTAATTVTVIPLAKKTVVFDAVALFDIDKSDLKPEGKEQLKAYREEAKAELSRADKITITGHTDNTGSAEHNMKLSLQRAEAVRDYLMGLGVDPSKMEVKGAGETNPMADNGTVEGRAKNRRVEVDITGLEK
ncbi:MAG: ompA [Deltaproteobacteria bacterium]|nr:ompA [Deltaproteobacteria bacterium]